MGTFIQCLGYIGHEYLLVLPGATEKNVFLAFMTCLSGSIHSINNPKPVLDQSAQVKNKSQQRQKGWKNKTKKSKRLCPSYTQLIMLFIANNGLVWFW